MKQSTPGGRIIRGSFDQARAIRYTRKGVISLEQLGEDTHGDLVYMFTRPWSDGTIGIKLSPLEFLGKLAALVPCRASGSSTISVSL